MPYSIYQITNTITRDFYIGKTVRDAESRFKSHIYSANKNNSNTHLHRAIRKYGIENFIIEVIETDISSKETLSEREKHWIEVLTPPYNMTPGGDGGSCSIITEEYRAKLRKIRSGSGNPMYGKRGLLNPKFGKKYGPNPKTSELKKNPCVCDGQYFSSIQEAEKHFKNQSIPVSVRKRLDSKHHPKWYRLVEKRKCPKKS